MNYSMIRYILAWVFTFEGIFLMLPAIVGGIYGEKQGLVYLAIAKRMPSCGDFKQNQKD